MNEVSLSFEGKELKVFGVYYKIWVFKLKLDFGKFVFFIVYWINFFDS